MDPISVSSGIAGLLTLTLQVGDFLSQYLSAIKDRKKDIQELQQELHLLSHVLRQLGAHVAIEQARGSRLDPESLLEKAIINCTDRILRIKAKIQPSQGNKLVRAAERLAWPFEQKEVRRLVDNLRSFHSTFSFALEVEGLTILSKISENAETLLNGHLGIKKQIVELHQAARMNTDKQLEEISKISQILELIPKLEQQAEDINEINQTTRHLEEQQREQRRTAILDWLLPKERMNRHRDVQGKRTKNTCQNFLHSEVFQQFVHPLYHCGDLLCLGQPGAGKTILSSFVIDHLRKHESDSTAVAHYYCSYAEDESQLSIQFARTILRQLCQTRSQIPVSVVDFYRRMKDKEEEELWLQKLQEVLQRVIATFDKVYVIVDALDEIGQRERAKLFDIIDFVRASNPYMQVFATSRPHLADMANYLRAAELTQIYADPLDLRHYITSRIEQHPDSDFIMDANLKEEIIVKLCENANGIFLLPKLQIDEILDQVTRADVRRALAASSTKLDEAFRSTLERVQLLSPGRRDLVNRALMWISHAKCPLRVSELQHALAVRPEDKQFDFENVVSISTILGSSFGLIEVDRNNIVRLVHFSLEEYLTGEGHGLYANAEEIITRTCLKYLVFPWLPPLLPKNRNDFIIALEDMPFASYATTYWGQHALGIPVHSYRDLTDILFQSSIYVQAMARIRDSEAPYFRKWRTRMTSWALSGGAGISIAASFGLSSLIDAICNDGGAVLDAQDFRGSQPLHQAAALGYTETCEVLIKHSADTRAQNQGKASPFYLAVRYNKLDTAKILLAHDRAAVDLRAKQGLSPLHCAVQMDSMPMVEFLLQSGSLVAGADDAGNTPLHECCKTGNLEIARLLCKHGSMLNARGTDRMRPIDLAANSGHAELVSYLIRQGADLSEDGRNWSPLHRASKSGHLETVKVLLANGASVTLTDRNKVTPLHLAAKSTSIECVKLILNHNPDLRWKLLTDRDRRGDTARTTAFTVARFDTYKYLRQTEHAVLLSMGTQIQVYDPTLPLSHAIEAGDLAEVKNVLERKPDLLHTLSPVPMLPLHLAFQEQQYQIAEHLLNIGADINSRAFHGWTAILIAASIGSLEMVELALFHGADVNAQSDTSQSSLHKASSSFSVPVIQCLLRAGGDVKAINERKMTPLHVAAGQNFLEGARELMKPEWGGEELILSRDAFGDTPRDWAERGGHIEMAAFLRMQEKRVLANQQNRIGNDMLSPRATLLQIERTNSNLSQRSQASSRTQTMTSTSPRHASTFSLGSDDGFRSAFSSRTASRLGDASGGVQGSPRISELGLGLSLEQFSTQMTLEPEPAT